MADPKLVFSLVDRIRPILANQDTSVQGAVLAELLSLWLAGHILEPRDDQAQAELREELMQHHMRLVRNLIPYNEETIRENMRKGAR